MDVLVYKENFCLEYFLFVKYPAYCLVLSDIFSYWIGLEVKGTRLTYHTNSCSGTENIKHHSGVTIDREC